jgi:MFS family permease
MSEYMAISRSSAIAVAADLTFSLLKPIWAKSSDIFGRAIIYPCALIFILVGLISAAASNSFPGFAAGTLLRVAGLTALNTINTVVISDFTSTRQRGFAVNFQFYPLVILPWVSSFIAQEVLKIGGIGWRWGTGILAIIFPFGVVGITTILLIYQKRAKKLEEQIASRPKQSISLYEFGSGIDLGGIAIIIGSLAVFLLPLSLAPLQPDRYSTPWVIALMVIGSLGLLVCLPIYEERFAAHPFFPFRYIKHRSIGIAFLLYFTDYMAASASHGYLYNWAYVAKGFSIMQASNLASLNGVVTFVTGMVFGLIMWYVVQLFPPLCPSFDFLVIFLFGLFLRCHS